MTKRFLSLLLALMMVLTLLPGMAMAEEKPTLKIAVARSSFDQTNSFDEKEIWADAEEMTGIHVEWIEMLDSDKNTQIPLMLAGGELPDVFMLGMGDSYIVENPEFFVPIQDMIEENCPNIWALYNTLDNWEAYLTYPDGNIYGLMGGYFKNPLGVVDATLWIRQDWLETIGKEVPTTMDELYEVLVAFRDNDVNGNGDAADEIPLEFCNNFYASNVLEWASAWGLPISNGVFYNVVDGEVVEAVNTEAFREFIEYFYKLGQEGLIDLEGFSMNNEQLNSNIASDKAGVIWHWEPSQAAWPATPEKFPVYQPMAPVAAEGYEAKVLGSAAINAQRNNFVITTACEDPAMALKWYDTISEFNFSHRVARGVEGRWWFFDNDGNMVGRQPSLEELASWGYDAGIDLGTIMYGNFHPLVAAGLTGDIANAPESYNARRFRAVLALEDYIAPTMTQQIMTAETSEELTFMTDGLGDYINAFVATSILNGITDASWDEYVSGLDTYGYDFYIEWYNNKLHGAQ